MSSKTLEIEEKNIDNAIEKACREFGVTRAKLNIEIISEGSNGFLGLGAKKAKIRASLLSFDMDFTLDETPAIRTEPKREVPEDKPIFRPEPRHETKRQDRSESARPESRREPRSKPEVRIAKPAPAAPRPPLPATDVQPDQAQEAAPRPPALVLPPVNAVPATSPAALKARDLLAGLLSKMTFECRVTATETDDTIILSIAGDDSGLLIGRRGQNLDAIQYLLNKAVNRSDAERKMIVVDSEEYRKRREESLLEMAERIREKVKKTQKPLSLAHMNAHDRRIIHLALQDDEALVTKSRGEGEYRKVIVLPAKKGNGAPRNRSRQ
ncbi:MAG: Jag N-terminal domain-containing protein [Deltaproteobacteria bacterium]|jgi:spoIIIJ-associated protein|nr:Jag N-terminal domain-containing protein [Syntrophaceae bacterium]